MVASQEDSLQISSYYAQSRPEMRAILPPTRRRVLEIGCSEGLFSGGITDAEEKWGVEPTQSSAIKARTQLTRVIDKYFEEAKFDLPKKYFDLVVCNDVIEHMADHEKFLTEIQEFMTNDGVLVGSIPNVRYYKNLFNILIAKDWEYTDSGTLDRTHLRFFTEKSLRRSLEKAGFDIEKFEGINGEVKFGMSKWKIAYFTFYALFRAISMGGAHDVAHLQFAFRVRLRHG